MFRFAANRSEKRPATGPIKHTHLAIRRKTTMLASEDICAVVEMVMKEMTDVSVEINDSTPRSENLTGYQVGISGAFNGNICIETSSDAALELASRMLSIELSETTEEDMQEVMGELTNMVGGNIKSLLPGPSALSIPRRLSGESVAAEQASDELRAISVRCGGHPVWITLNQS